MVQTSIDWLVEKLQESGITFLKDELEMIEQAKEIEKKQQELISAQRYIDGFNKALEVNKDKKQR